MNEPKIPPLPDELIDSIGLKFDWRKLPIAAFGRAVETEVSRQWQEALQAAVKAERERNAELERVLGVARTTIDRMKDTETYQSDEDECGSYVCCDHISYRGHKDDCHAVNAIAAIDAILAKKEGV